MALGNTLAPGNIKTCATHPARILHSSIALPLPTPTFFYTRPRRLLCIRRAPSPLVAYNPLVAHLLQVQPLASRSPPSPSSFAPSLSPRPNPNNLLSSQSQSQPMPSRSQQQLPALTVSLRKSKTRLLIPPSPDHLLCDSVPPALSLPRYSPPPLFA